MDLADSGYTNTDSKKNDLVKHAVVRNFEIIGEASNHIPLKIKNSYPDIPWKEMNGMRNFLIHEYFDMDEDIVWYTAKKHLPQLISLLKEISLHE